MELREGLRHPARAELRRPLRSFGITSPPPPRQGLGVAWSGVEDHVPQPLGFGAVAALFGEDSEVANGEMAVDALIDATELVGTPESQDSPPEGFCLGRLAGFAMEDGLAKMQLGVVGVEP